MFKVTLGWSDLPTDFKDFLSIYGLPKTFLKIDKTN